MKLLYVYLIFCAVVLVIGLTGLAIEQFIYKHRDPKFGWNFQWPPWNSMALNIVCLAALPVVNIVFVLLLIYNICVTIIDKPPVGSPAWYDVQIKKKRIPKHPILVECSGCGNRIDPDFCWCGERMKDHHYGLGHAGVPIGCDCWRGPALA